MIFALPLLVIFLTIWGFNMFYFDVPPNNPKSFTPKQENNKTNQSKKAQEYFKKYIEK